MTAVYLFKACKEAQLFDKDNSVTCARSAVWHHLSGTFWWNNLTIVMPVVVLDKS